MSLLEKSLAMLFTLLVLEPQGMLQTSIKHAHTSSGHLITIRSCVKLFFALSESMSMPPRNSAYYSLYYNVIRVYSA